MGKCRAHHARGIAKGVNMVWRLWTGLSLASALLQPAGETGCVMVVVFDQAGASERLSE